MNVATMRLVDRWIGMPTCAALTVARRVGDLLRKPRSRPVRRILFVKLAEQGATVLAHEALCQAIQRVGRDNVYFLVFEENRFIIEVLGLVPEANVVTIRTDTLWITLAETIRAVRRIRKLGIDAVIDMEQFARSSAILCYLSGAAHRVGYHASGGEAGYRGDLLTHRLSYNAHLHTSLALQTLVKALDVPADQLPAMDISVTEPRALPMFEPASAEVAEVREAIVEAAAKTGAAFGSHPLILLNANCSDLLPLRRWEFESYVELAQRLLARYSGLRILLTGAPGERAAAETMAVAIGTERCISMAGRTTLRQLLVLYGLAEVLVTNDSGPAHFATLTPIDVVTLFGPETPALYGARTPRSHILWAGLPCSPCVNAYNGRYSPCRDNLCMQRITVDQVFERVCRVYESRRTLPHAH